jgi:hypothetical protein
LPKRKPIRSKPQLARSLAVFLLAFGVFYFATLLYVELPPAKLIFGSGAVAYLALINGFIYGIAGWLIVSALYRSK